MSVSVADLIHGRAKTRIDRALPTLGGAAFLALVEGAIERQLGDRFPGQGPAYLRKLLSALETPLPRVLVSGWRKYEQLLEFTAAEGRPASSGRAEIVDHEIDAYWEITPRFESGPLTGPSLLVALSLVLEAGTIVVQNGRFVALEAGELKYSGSLKIKDAPEQLAAIGPGRSNSTAAGWTSGRDSQFDRARGTPRPFAQRPEPGGQTDPRRRMPCGAEPPLAFNG